MNPNSEKMPLLLTAKRVCEELGITPRGLRKMVQRGDFPKPVRFPKGGRTIRFRREDFERYLESLRPKARTTDHPAASRLEPTATERARKDDPAAITAQERRQLKEMILEHGCAAVLRCVAEVCREQGDAANLEKAISQISLDSNG